MGGKVREAIQYCPFLNVPQVCVRTWCRRAALRLFSPSWRAACTVFTMPLKVSSPLCSHPLTVDPSECGHGVFCVKCDLTLLCSRSVCPEMSKHYNQKAGLEQELPTVTQKLLTTSECLLGSLGSLTSSTGKVRPTGGRLS